MALSERKLFHLKGKVQHYAWGGYDFIPGLLGVKNDAHEPYAEYWLGAHDKAASLVEMPDHPAVPLNRLIAQWPGHYLGTAVASRFGRLPFLFKILDVRDMLSIQVHPTRAEAEKGFARENAAGIALDAAFRNYKDDNHKPELMVALSEFWLLHGFLPEKELETVLHDIPGFSALTPVFREQGYRGLYRHIMTMPQEEVNRILIPLLHQALPLYREGSLHRNDPAFWAARAVDSGMSAADQPDRGIFSIYFFNIVRLQPGEGIFQAAGIPHAYLEGQNVELMANSDNVLRGGLTSKHVDVEELLHHTRFEGIVPGVMKGKAPAVSGEREYACPVPDFTLSTIAIGPDQPFQHEAVSLEILLVITGSAMAEGSASLPLAKGDALLVLPGERYRIAAAQGAVCFKASVPVDRWSEI